MTKVFDNCLNGWVCEEHPDKPWPHDDCPGPGMPCTHPDCPYPKDPPPVAWDTKFASTDDDE